MTDMSEISVGVSHELAITACKVGFKPIDFANLAHSDNKMSEILGVLRGTHEIKPIDHTIDLDSPCELPFPGAEVEVHRGSGIVKLEKRNDDLYLNGKKITLFLSKKQKGDGRVVGHELRKELEKRGRNISAKVLDYLVQHPNFWPEHWKKDGNGNTIYVFFWDDIWDDIFRSPAYGRLCVRCGYWSDGGVVSHYLWLDHGWYGYSPSAFVAS